MAFNRIGTPVDLSAVNFNSKESFVICCEECGKKVGRGLKGLAKFAGTDTVVVAPRGFVCPHCGASSTVSKKK